MSHCLGIQPLVNVALLFQGCVTREPMLVLLVLQLVIPRDVTAFMYLRLYLERISTSTFP